MWLQEKRDKKILRDVGVLFMRIQLLNGGLGNQVFQYLFVRFAERYCPEETWYFDDSYFFVTDAHNGYELEKIWGIKANLLSNYFDADVWAEIIRLVKAGVSLPQTFLDMGLSLSMLAETTGYSFNGRVMQVNANEFQPEVTKVVDGNNNIYYHGYWINKNWFSTYREENLAELTFPAFTDDRNKRYADMINNCFSIGIHIRRGDFITLGWALPIEYYQNACRALLEKCPEAHFFVFTDDAEWCQTHAEDLGLNLAPQTTFITGNVKPNNFRDLQLLSMCQGMIISNSSFCYLAALLDQNLKVWINPTEREI